MLGRLLNLGSGSSAATTTQEPARGSSSQPVLTLDSVQEDIHTKNLLFPDAQTLYQHRNDQVFPFSDAPSTPAAQTPTAYDYNDEVDLDVRDVRILIMQDALGPANASLLFDSHPPPETNPSATSSDSRKPPLSSRRGSTSHTAQPVVIHQDNPQPRQGAFDRRSSLHGRQHSYGETESQRVAREYREELATFSSCIFGNSELMAYKGTSTKVHVVPNDARHNDQTTLAGDGRSSLGRSSMRSSKLSQSYSSQVFSPTYAPLLPGAAIQSRSGDKKKVLITRLFPVTLSADDVEQPTDTTPQGRFPDAKDGFPFPPANEEPTVRKKLQPKQRRTPMYAVVLVVQLSPNLSRSASAVQPKPIFKESGSYSEQDFFSSSYGSTRATWNMSGSAFYSEATDSSFSFDMEDRIDPLTRHWDIIMRTLTHLQSLVATKIHLMLKRADAASPGAYTTTTAGHNVSNTSSFNERRSNEMPRRKQPKSTTKLVSLWPNSLADDITIASEAGLARSRIVMGLSAARVITGQGRWGIWRDEAIWAAKWAATSDKGTFPYNLLAGFLATHTDWLQGLCSQSLKRRAALQRQKRTEEDIALPARTVIISDDKMVARRLLFLLSAFLPCNQHLNPPRAHRPSLSAAWGPFSNSPPTYVIPLLREESLRRKINRRTGLPRVSHSRTTSQSTRASGVPAQLVQLTLERNPQRRASDAASIKTANLPLLGSEASRKSSAATTTTVIPETTMPHFSGRQRPESLRPHRPESSGSSAADDLKRSLRRDESNASVASSGSRPPSQGLKWGNIVSGLWTARRRESTDSTAQSQGSAPISPVKATATRTDKLTHMVQEASAVAEEPDSLSGSPRQTRIPSDVVTPHGLPNQGRFSFSKQDRTPNPNGAFDSPVKTSINAEDGIIDVDVPFPDYIASFESAISSPSSSGYLSTPALPGVDLFETGSRTAMDGDTPMNAVGWLNRFHPDFALQAIPPQDSIMEKVKAALRAEPTPVSALTRAGNTTQWVDIGSAIIADTTANSITRLVYRRLVRSKGRDDQLQETGASLYSGHLLTPSILPYETQLDEEWIEEPICDSDETLVEALEKVIHLHPELSKDNSTTSSVAHSDTPDLNDDGDIMTDTYSEVTQLAESQADVPRVQCKTLVVSALEDILRDVIDHRDEYGNDPSRLGRNTARHTNVLRDAVRHWVNNLDMVD